MSNAPQPLSPKELKEIKTYLKKKNIDIQVQFSPQKIRRMEDGGVVIDPPVFNTTMVKVEPLPTDTNGETKLDTQ